MSPSHKLLCLLPLALHVEVSARAADPAPVALTNFPATLAGVPVDVGASDGSNMRYMTKGVVYDQTPLINLMSGPTTAEVPLANTRLAMRKSIMGWGLRAIAREQTFLSPLAPGKTGLAAEYVTGAGIFQTWTIRTGTTGYIVLALMHREADRQKVWDAVSKDIFHVASYAELPKDSPK